MNLYQLLESLKTKLVELSRLIPFMPKINPIEQMVRRVCKEEGMTVGQTELIVAVIYAESGMNPKAVNKNIRNGKVVSTDYGICQLNDYWYRDKIGFPDEALNNPEKCVRIMCRRVKQPNGINDWWAYRNKSYLKFLKV